MIKLAKTCFIAAVAAGVTLPAIAAEKSEGDAKTAEIVQRMKAMRLPEVAFEPSTTIVDAVSFFYVVSKKYDLAEIPMEKRGFNMRLRLGCSKADAPVIPMLRLTDVSFYDALKFVFSSVGYEFEINYEADLDKAIVTIKPCSGSAKCGSSGKSDSIAKYNYVVDTSAAPELDQWMRAKMLPAVREWYPRLLEMFPLEGWKAPKTITLKFDAREDSPPAYTCGDVVAFSRKWINKNPGDVGCGIHELFHVVQGGYPDRKTFWLQEGLADYVRWYLYEPESHGCDMDLSSDRVRYCGTYRVSANFLNFVERKYPGTVRELNALCHEGKYDEATYWKNRTGKDVRELEAEWKGQSGTAQKNQSKIEVKNQPRQPLSSQPFKNYRFCVDSTKRPSDSMQLSEFELLDAGGERFSEFAFVFASTGDHNFGRGEKPRCAVDGNRDTKWLDFRAAHGADAASRASVWIQFHFDEPTKISGYRWYTANDFEERDPRSWRLLGSDDEVDWVLVDEVKDFQATSDRKALAFAAQF